MQVKTLLTVKEFRTRFAKTVSPEYAAGVHTTADGMWISGKSTKTDFYMQVTKPGAASLLVPQVHGKILRTEDGCNVSWKIRRSKGAYIALGISAALSMAVAFPLAYTAVSALQAAWFSDPRFWGLGISFALITVAALAGAALALCLLFCTTKRKRAQLHAEMLRIIGEENLVTEE